ncbi:MAG: hypothetical protein J6P60_06145 [Lachnospiraceae bacterium]|nr:hypothetical protein [Lachnospiraceae bacterium]
MKRLYRIGLFCVAFGSIFLGYHIFAPHIPFFQTNDANKQPAPIIQNITIDEEGNVMEMSLEPAKEEQQTSGKADTLTCDTRYIVRKLDRSLGTEEVVADKIPEKFIGKNREQVEELIEDYNMAPALKDLENGFASMELDSFSVEKIQVTKRYYSDLSKEHFYLIAENNFITVYYSDLKSVYLYTDISLDALPADLQHHILDKKYVESEQELYDFLESYTS